MEAKTPPGHFLSTILIGKKSRRNTFRRFPIPCFELKTTSDQMSARFLGITIIILEKIKQRFQLEVLFEFLFLYVSIHYNLDNIKFLNE